MYSDKDGTASKQSQADYERLVGRLKVTTTFLSLVGFYFAFQSGDLAKPVAAVWSSESIIDFLLENARYLWPLLVLQNIRLQFKHHPIEVYNTAVVGAFLSCLLCASDLLKARDGRSFENDPLWSITHLPLHTASVLIVLQLSFPRRPLLFAENGHVVDAELSVSAIDRFSMRWGTSIVNDAARFSSLQELPKVDYATRSRSQTSIALDGQRKTLWDFVVHDRLLLITKQWSLVLGRSVVTFGAPYCTMRLLKVLEQPDDSAYSVWFWLIGLTVSSLSYTVIHSHLMFMMWSEMGVPIRGQLIMTLFKKLMNRKDSKLTAKSGKSNQSQPEVINLVSSDTVSFSFFGAVNYVIPGAFIRFLFAGAFLSRLLGWQSALCGIVAASVCVPVHVRLVSVQRKATQKLSSARDRRSKAVSEALYALRQIKFSSSEQQWEEYLNRLRDEELKLLRKTFVISNLESTWNALAPFLVAASCLYGYVRFQGSLAPSIVYPMLEVLPHLEHTLGFLPTVFRDYFIARVNSKRMDEYLRKPDQLDIAKFETSGDIVISGASISWPSDDVEGILDGEKSSLDNSIFTLEHVNVCFPAGELSIIHGKTGSGKSLLLAAILGEADLLHGTIPMPKKANDKLPIAYVAQTPWLQNASVQANILFGAAMDQQRYQTVLEQCALIPDLATLTKGDQTVVGVKGVKLSGGQSARVALARALYSDAQIVVMDDILSAVDTRVARQLLSTLTGELGRGRTRILVTHQVDLCLPFASYTVHIGEKISCQVRTPTSLPTTNEELQGDSNDSGISTMEKREANSQLPNGKSKSNSGQARSDLAVYRDYFRAAGGRSFAVTFFVLLVIIQSLNASTRWLLLDTKSTNTAKRYHKLGITDNLHEDDRSFYLYLCASFLTVLVSAFLSWFISHGSMKISTTLSSAMIAKVLRMPLAWIDETPMGKNIKVFNVDIKAVDAFVLEDISEIANSGAHLVTVLALGLYTSYYTVAVTFTLLWWWVRLSQRYLKGRTLVKRGDAVPTSQILELFASSISGLPTLRAFNAVPRTLEQMHDHIDDLSTARRYFFVFNRWIGLQISLVGIVFTALIGTFVLSSKLFTSPSFVGFLLTFSMKFSEAVWKAVNSFGMLESHMASAASVIDFTKLRTEDQAGESVPREWPIHGQVDVRNVDLSYGTGLPLVLKDVSFSIQPHTRLGIIGRTGAGKSSLALSLLRLLDIQRGSIFIDGLDISKIELTQLRSRIAYIPQNPVLFSGTIRSNLDYFKKFPDEVLIGALQRVGLKAQKEKEQAWFNLDSPVSAGGTSISQGQRQLLCLARILIQKPRMIIVDEATSAIDDETDNLVQNVLRDSFDVTTIVVAHRLKTVIDFESILVMDDGKVAEHGPPSTLYAKKGQFFDLVQLSHDKDRLVQRLIR